MCACVCVRVRANCGSTGKIKILRHFQRLDKGFESWIDYSSATTYEPLPSWWKSRKITRSKKGSRRVFKLTSVVCFFTVSFFRVSYCRESSEFSDEALTRDWLLKPRWKVEYEEARGPVPESGKAPREEGVGTTAAQASGEERAVCEEGSVRTA